MTHVQLPPPRHLQTRQTLSGGKQILTLAAELYKWHKQNARTIMKLVNNPHTSIKVFFSEDYQNPQDWYSDYEIY